MEAEFLTSYNVKKSLIYFDTPEGEEWRAPLVRELISIRDGQLDLQGFTAEEIKTLLDNLCETWGEEYTPLIADAPGEKVFPLGVTSQFFLPQK